MVVYRYMKSYGFDTLRDGRFKLASVLDLNDPFEGLGRCVGLLTEMAAKEYFREANRQNIPFSESGFEVIWNRLSDVERHSLREMYSDRIRSRVLDRTLVSFMYVLCLSTCEDGDPAQKLMWSHYADGYKGVRIGFRMEDPQFPLYFDSLKYCWERPILDLSKITKLENDEETNRFWIQNLTTKSNEWAYERECRIIADDLHLEKGLDDKGHDAYFWRFDPASVVSVDVGFRMLEAEVQAIKEIVRSKYPVVSLRKVLPSDTNYGIVYQKLP